MHVRTRIPPSPTGEDLHIGSVYTALLNYAFAKKHEGEFIIRIEDTDQARLVKGAEEKFLQTLKDYGINYDEGPDKEGAVGPYRQSERLEIYQRYAKDLIESGKAYYCICSKERLEKLRDLQQKNKQISKYDKHCLGSQDEIKKKIDNGEKYVIRLNVEPKIEVKFNDLIHGDIVINTDNLDDQVLMKSDGFPTYHLAVVVDDHFMKISHVIRGEEWISSTPKHVLLYEAFGWEKPIFAHVPLLRNPNKSKMSKRKDPVWASWYLKQGFLPEAILNYLSLMGWSHPKQKEIFDLEEFIKVFDLKDMKPVGPAFDVIKLEWMNGSYIRAVDNEILSNKINSFYEGKYPKELIDQTIPLVKERIKKLSDYYPLSEFFFEAPKKYEVDEKKYKELVSKMHKTLSTLKEWKAEEIGKTLQELAEKEGVKNSEFFMVARVIITGKKISPPLNESMELLGKEESLKRLKI